MVQLQTLDARGEEKGFDLFERAIENVKTTFRSKI